MENNRKSNNGSRFSVEDEVDEDIQNEQLDSDLVIIVIMLNSHLACCRIRLSCTKCILFLLQEYNGRPSDCENDDEWLSCSDLGSDH